MNELKTNRLLLKPYDRGDFKRFIETMLTDEHVVTFYFSYQGLKKLEKIKEKAEKDFWAYFERARSNNLEVFAVYMYDDKDTLVGWSGLVLSDITDAYGGSELQYMLASEFHGKGLATELAQAVLDHAKNDLKLDKIIATVDVPNVGSSLVIEKLGFELKGQIEAYGSTEMYFYDKYLISHS